MELIGLERNGSIEQAHLNMMGFKLPEPEETNSKLPKDKQPTDMERRGMSRSEWEKYIKRSERGIRLFERDLERDLERQGLTQDKPVAGLSFEPNRIFA